MKSSTNLPTWEKLRDQPALILFDSGATYNFISKDLAMKLGIKAEELGRAMDAEQIFQGESVHGFTTRKCKLYILIGF